MRHVGDITKLHGWELEPVDCITGGSPCQDLSLAGKRAGLAGERSGLFMEQIRLIKEMRDATRGTSSLHGRGIKPKYMVWENVCGAFSSNGGKDFQAVLTEIARIVCKDCPDVPLPEKGRWTKSGCLMGYGDDGQPFSIAYRLHDAQFWGVPQRRKRISLVADFGGQSAPEILFERKGMRRDPEEGGETREGTSSDVKRSVAATITSTYGTKWNGNAGAYNGENFVLERAISFQERAGKPGGGKGILIQDEHTGALSTLNKQSVLAFEPGIASREGGHCYEDKAGTLRAEPGDNAQAICYGIGGYNSEGMKSDNPHSGIYEADTSRTLDLNGGNPACNQGGMAVVVQEPVSIGNGQLNQMGMQPVANTLDTMHDQQAVMTWGIDRAAYNQGQNAQFKPQFDVEKSASLIAKGPNAVATHTVRRLTPMECERLQGFPSEIKVDVSKMTKDEYIAWNLAEKNIIVDAGKGKVFATRGPGGLPYKEPKELQGTILNGYKVVSIRNGATKLMCRVHRIVWISKHGIIPDGYVVDHINNDKQDNRISNLQILTQEDNSHKAKEDGLYKEGLDNKATKIDPDLKDEIAFLYAYSEATMRDLAELYGVSKSRIHQIIHEVGWTDIGEWTDSKGKVHESSDSARYKALGNSIALPFWFYLLRRISAQYERPATLGSLFDGIGGFPLCWERCNGKGTAIWASEVEEFCIAVTRRRFPNGNVEECSNS